jgi:T-complex protein 1 subunit delta
MSQPAGGFTPKAETGLFQKNDRERDVRISNIKAAKAVADVIRTSLGPRGMDKMIQDSKGEVLITNDGATILKQMEVVHPTAKMLVEISKAQDIEAGDGTTSVVVLAGALLEACESLLYRGIHPTAISEAFGYALEKAKLILKTVADPVSLEDREALITCVQTSLASKVVSHNANLAPLAVDAVLKIIDPKTATNVDLKDVKVVRKLGGTMDDTELVDGLVFVNNKPSSSAGGPTRIVDPKIALIQFCLSAPKTDIQNNVVVKDYTAMDRILKEERQYIAEQVKQIVKSGANVLLIQKSILRDAVNELSLHFLAKKNIMVVKDIEREDVEFISKTIGAIPVASIDHLTPDKLGRAKLIDEVTLSDESKILKITGVPAAGKTVSILVRGSNQLVLDEADRSIHDALCVVRSLVKTRGMIPGGGAPEVEIAQKLEEHSQQLEGVKSICVRAYAEALEIIPYTLSENAGLNPIRIVTELRSKHKAGFLKAGINVKKGHVSEDITKEKVVQPTLVTDAALTHATEVTRMILKIDDIILSAR